MGYMLNARARMVPDAPASPALFGIKRLSLCFFRRTLPGALKRSGKRPRLSCGSSRLLLERGSALTLPLDGIG
ncbi:MAG: hypothetical protein LBD42_03305 [Desulfovibrio sp.]|jgi:hypothetical protein|nr:hypothetical protein [Desulfovibrio sp.]